MSKIDTLFKSAGICTHANGNIKVTKVRYGTDFVRQIKMLSNPKKIEDRKAGVCLSPVRVDIIELPTEMTKMEVLAFLSSHENFQSPEDQALISEEQFKRQPKTPRAKKEKTVKVKASKKSNLSLDSIKSRTKKSTATVEDVLNAVSEPSAA
jgi:hypothetical protein